MYQIFKLTENISFGLIVTYHNAAKSDSERLAYHVLYIIPLQKLKKKLQLLFTVNDKRIF